MNDKPFPLYQNHQKKNQKEFAVSHNLKTVRQKLKMFFLSHVVVFGIHFPLVLVVLQHLIVAVVRAPPNLVRPTLTEYIEIWTSMIQFWTGSVQFWTGSVQFCYGIFRAVFFIVRLGDVMIGSSFAVKVLPVEVLKIGI